MSKLSCLPWVCALPLLLTTGCWLDWGDRPRDTSPSADGSDHGGDAGAGGGDAASADDMLHPGHPDGPDASFEGDSGTDGVDGTDGEPQPLACADLSCPGEFPCEGTDQSFTCAGQQADFPVGTRPKATFASAFVVDNAKFVVLDNVTGLMWEQLVEDAERDRYMTWDEARARCAGLEHAGYTDWRLPSLMELFTTLAADEQLPYESGLFMRADHLWSSVANDRQGTHFALWTGNGLSWGNEATGTNQVQCVRTDSVGYTGGPSQRYQVSGGEVHDLRTGLTFREAVPGEMTYDDAVAYCAGLDASQGAWRMPTVLEGMTTIDADRVPEQHALAPVYQGPFSCYWTSTFALDTNTPFWVSGAFGNPQRFDPADTLPADMHCLIRCVR